MLGVLDLCLVAAVPYRIRSLLSVVSSVLAVVSGFLNFECVFLSQFWNGCIVLFGLSSLFLFMDLSTCNISFYLVWVAS